MMIDLWNSQDASQYSLQGAPAAYQQPSVTASGGDPQPGQFQHQIFHPKNADDYELIPPGAMFIDPQDGQLYQKTSPKRGVEA